MSESSSSMEWRLEAFEPRPSLWRLVEQSVPGSERVEIKEVLGEDLVDETLDLHNEVETMLGIWRDYRDETEKEERENALKVHLNKLPEPPMIRENLKQEIRLFAEMLRQKTEEEGSNVFSVLTRRDSELLEYAADKQVHKTPDTASRPSTFRSSRDGRQTPMRATPSSDGSRCASSLSDHLETVNDQLNALDIDRIGENLRQLLREEREGLFEDISFLQDSLMEESEYRQQVTTPAKPEPSLKDLRDLGTKLEKEMLKSSANNANTIRTRKDKQAKLVTHLSLEEKTRRVDSKSGTAAGHVTCVPRPPISPPARQSHIAGASLGLGSTVVISHSTRHARGQLSPSPPNLAKHEPLSPSPPSSAKPSRPGSATRFRRMVLDCRDSVR